MINFKNFKDKIGFSIKRKNVGLENVIKHFEMIIMQTGINKAIFGMLMFLLIGLPFVSSSTVTIGIEPAVVNVNLVEGEGIVIPFKLYNELGDTDAEYIIELEEDLKDFIVYDDCDMSWCTDDNPILVPKGTTRGSPVIIEILFKGKTSGTKNVESGIYIYGSPVGVENEGTVAIKPRVKVNVNVMQFDGETTTSTTTTPSTTPQSFTTVKKSSFQSPTNPPTPTTVGMTTTPLPSTPRPPSRPSPTREISTTTVEQTQSEEFNWLWVGVPVVIVIGIGGIFAVWYFDLLPSWLWFSVLLLSIPLVRAGSVDIGVTVGEVFDYFDLTMGVTQTMENDTVVKETSDVYVSNIERSGDRFTYHIVNNRSTTVFVSEIILDNPMKPKEYRVGSIRVGYTTDSGENIEVDVFVESPVIHIRPHSLIPIEPSTGSNTLELDFNPNVVGMMTGLLPLITGVGIIFFVVRQFFESPSNPHFSVEWLTGIMLTIIIAIVLLTVLVASI